MNLLHKAHRLAQFADEQFEQELSRTASGKTVITARQAIVLAAIHGNPSVSQTRIVATTGIDRSTLSDIVRRLEKDGLARRTRSREDARAYEISLTNRGTKALTLAQQAAVRAERTLRDQVPSFQMLALGPLIRGN